MSTTATLSASPMQERLLGYRKSHDSVIHALLCTVGIHALNAGEIVGFDVVRTCTCCGKRVHLENNV